MLTDIGPEESSASEIILETCDLTKSFSGYVAVDAVSLKVKRGSIHAIIGPNGAGKTTLFNLMTRFLAPTAGAIMFDGQNITTIRPAAVARKGMVRSFQISSIFPDLTVRDNIRLALQRRLNTSFRFWRSERCLDVLNDRSSQLAEAVGLGELLSVRAAELPYGRKRALELATTIALDPKILLLDEPTAGMGREDVENITALIRRVAEHRTVVLVEHNIGVVATLSNMITVMQRGRIIAEGPYAEVSQDQTVKKAYLGLSHA